MKYSELELIYKTAQEEVEECSNVVAHLEQRLAGRMVLETERQTTIDRVFKINKHISDLCEDLLRLDNMADVLKKKIKILQTV